MTDKAKGYVGLFLFVAVLCGLFRACTSFHDHEWQDATCTTAKTCTVCGDTDGDPPGHQWEDATCSVPKTCTICGETKGKTVSHKWEFATCETPRICSVCGAESGKPYGHDFNIGQITVKPTCQTPGENTSYCSRCGVAEITVVPVVDHDAGDWQTVDGTPDYMARYCTMCGKELERKEITLSGSGGTGGSGTGGVGSNFNTHNNTGQQNTSASYVLNTSTMKFHRPSCRDVPRIASQNYATSSSSRSDLISRGYSACGHCNP